MTENIILRASLVLVLMLVLSEIGGRVSDTFNGLADRMECATASVCLLDDAREG